MVYVIWFVYIELLIGCPDQHIRSALYTLQYATLYITGIGMGKLKMYIQRRSNQMMGIIAW